MLGELVFRVAHGWRDGQYGVAIILKTCTFSSIHYSLVYVKEEAWIICGEGKVLMFEIPKSGKLSNSLICNSRGQTCNEYTNHP